ncbi:hypothetical protein VN12_04400 [Pirellula sp. SH-Sr6A]|uniref:hypothetical protein n=1 Tax=Pirellula sp. SH-Sr6A TaxID=1632865 RepID=UPI00078DCFE6|nr:hypothetical protein [Pirellula sp. SH-Sr6A]AMV31334.1 hypothetical protein VN12_04400 [Pirellula sp. SH-Sr6A]
MGLSIVTYNGYQFPDRSNVEVDEEFVYDQADWTVIETKFVVRVTTLITNEEQYNSPVFNSSLEPDAQWQNIAAFAGPTMHRARQALSKAGGQLSILHDGFGPHLEINQSAGGVRDVSWGPKPRILRWTPVGHTHAVEVVWECEFRIPICSGDAPPKFTGLKSHNYEIGFSYDDKGYTTRTINGRVEIALTRQLGGRALVDSVDRYRNLIDHAKPDNFRRTVDWNISLDKRVANYTIIDREISSPNAWPQGVVDIQAKHRVNWSRAVQLARVSNSISMTVELAPTESKSRAWLIFRGLFQKRINFSTDTVFIYSLDVEEEIFSNRVSFSLNYYFLSQLDVINVFNQSGLFQTVSDELDNWAAWSTSTKVLQPLQGGQSQVQYGYSGLKHEPQIERIVDLCDNFPGGGGDYPNVLTKPTVPPPSLCNSKPPADKSWLKYEAVFKYNENSPAYTAVSLRENDLLHKTFSPSNIDAALPDVEEEGATRWIEERAGSQEFILQGYAERVGYQIPKPGRILVGGNYYRPIGKGVYAQKFMGTHFCQPLFAAVWKQKYRLDRPLTKLNPKDENGGVE